MSYSTLFGLFTIILYTGYPPILPYIEHIYGYILTPLAEYVYKSMHSTLSMRVYLVAVFTVTYLLFTVN